MCVCVCVCVGVCLMSVVSFKLSLYAFRKIDLVWFGLVLCHFNHCRSFNAKSFFIHILDI